MSTVGSLFVLGIIAIAFGLAAMVPV
jgi:hypothetical protein